MGLFILFSFVLTLTGISQESGLYELSSKTIQGQDYSFQQLRGKKVMIVNTASKCSLSPQIKSLQQLYEAYQDRGFVVIGFPQNDFGNREPGTNPEIRENLDKRFGISFPLMEKISVKGPDIHPVYQWLTQKDKNGVMDAEIKWNFQKFLIDENGQLVKILEPLKKPDGEEVIQWILGEK